MLGFAWLTLRQAREALKNGRLEEVHRLLGNSAARGHKRSWKLQRQLAEAFAQRGQEHLRFGNPDAAWHDLLHAEQLGADAGDASRLRQGLTARGLEQARGFLRAGEPNRAAETLAVLRERCVREPEWELLDEAARAWLSSREQAGRGEFGPAAESVERAQRLLAEPVAPLDAWQRDVDARRKNFAALLILLHEAAGQERWRDVVDLSEKVLAAAPQHVEARKARARAWKAIEPVTVTMARPTPTVTTVEPAEAPPRFLLWIDGVGGYLVCLAPRVTLGQATPEAGVDVPLFADVSREHAVIVRDAEGYSVEGLRAVEVNGRAVEKAPLRTNDRITLGTSCQLLFRQPVPVSTSARLDLVSGQRLPLSVDGVLLMSDTLVLGPGANVHVGVPDLKENVVLFRQKDGLGVRHGGPLQVDGASVRGRTSLGPSSTVVGDDFAFSLEAVGARFKGSWA